MAWGQGVRSSTDPPFTGGPHSEIGFSWSQTLKLKYSCASPGAPSHPFHPFFPCPTHLDVKFWAEIIAMLDRIWGTTSRQLRGCLGEGASCVLMQQAQRCLLEDLKPNGKTGTTWPVRKSQHHLRDGDSKGGSLKVKISTVILCLM